MSSQPAGKQASSGFLGPRKWRNGRLRSVLDVMSLKGGKTCSQRLQKRQTGVYSLLRSGQNERRFANFSPKGALPSFPADPIKESKPGFPSLLGKACFPCSTGSIEEVLV